MSTTTIIIESESAEPYDVTISASEDPTDADPEFQVTSIDVTSPTGSWSDGEWLTTWDTSKRLTARTPTIGKTGVATLELTEGSRYTLWIRWGSVVKRAATVVVQ